MKIFLAVMNWGLGHATRCVPLVQQLLLQGNEVILGGEGRSLQLLRHYFPHLPFLTLPAYDIKYAASDKQIPILLRQIPHLLRTFQKEHEFLEAQIPLLGIEKVISDNRYGLWSKQIPCVFITHQLAPIAPFFALTHKLHLFAIRKFTEIWIPDNPHLQLAGKMAHQFPLPANASFIGLLSHFAVNEGVIKEFSIKELNEISPPDIIVILSGPEPQRTLFSEIIQKEAQKITQNVWLVEGKTEENTCISTQNLTRISYLSAADLRKVLAFSPIVISRSGYSSLMDYHFLKLQKIVLVPTSGQTEQEYLAEMLEEKKIAMMQMQNAFDLERVLREVDDYQGFN